MSSTRAMRPRCRAAACAICLPLLLVVVDTAAAAAQSVFLQGSYGADVRRFAAGEGEQVFDAASPGFAAGLSGFLAGRITAGIELDAGSTSTESRSVSLSIAGRPATVTTAYSMRRRTVSALAGVHTRSGERLQFGAYAGLAFNSVRREIASDAPPIVLGAPPEPSVFTDRTTDPIVGADLAVKISPHLAIVGTVRAQGLTLSSDLHGFSVRPGAGVRLIF